MAFASGSNYRWERWISPTEAISGTGPIKHTRARVFLQAWVYFQSVGMAVTDSHMNKEFRMQVLRT